MPKFHFHLSKGSQLLRDLDGLELPDLERAIVEARADCRGLAIEELKAGRAFPVLSKVVISDGDGTVLHVESCRLLLGSDGDQHATAEAAR